MPLCKFCSDLFNDSDISKWAGCRSGIVHRELKQFLESVDLKCFICSTLRTKAGESDEVFESKWLADLRQGEMSIKVGHYGGHYLLDACMGDTMISLDLQRIAVDARLTKPPSWRITSVSTGSEETFSKIESWLGRCDSDSRHEKCRQYRGPHQSKWFPTRLLYIDSQQSLGGLRIVHGKDVPAGLPYVTLSHQWGSETEYMPKLTMQNIASWTEHVPEESLPRTFKEAIQVALRFRVNHIWIDSLCIIQDGDELHDWNKEAPTMQNVYSRALFNICAAWSSELGGLFSRRDPVDVEFPQIRFCSSSKEEGEQHFLVRRLEDSPSNIWARRVNTSPLCKRGWVFQERLLSSRNVFFCDGEALFECHREHWSESTGTDLQSSSDASSYTSGLKWGEFPKSLLPAAEEDLDLSWQILVEQYSSTDLTKRHDRLVAVAGIAQRFRAMRDDDIYLAGLWVSNLALQMLWENDSGNQEKRWLHRGVYQQGDMSFSWHSAGGARQIWRYSTLNKQYVLPNVSCIKWRASTAMDAEVQPFIEDIFTLPRVPCVEIMVKGTLKRMKIEWINRTMVISLGLIDPGVVTQHAHGFEPDTPTFDFALSQSEITTLNNSNTLFYVPWYYAKGFKADDEGPIWDRMFYYMLLELVDTKMARFRRLGLLHLESKRDADVYLKPQVDEAELPCWHYDPVARKHTFFIV